ncbi:hypothetical protein KC19_8G093400 [Ceratodon purpureus]|uniref:RING-type E3 ubiquitin transferase n=1 Tax=Ceratodon purpureus TaxID=3225 RepID=A0A8T0GZD2_CERPU|nr:hypothetical protein KC19_8G093400 [Ceratodon purpureus]
MKRKFEFDEEIAECPLCNEFLSPPIHQCKNGHLACKDCCEMLKRKECPTCRAKPFAHSRNLGLEKMIESLQSACVHAPYGCTELVKLEKEKHVEDACDYRQFRCPVMSCSYTGPKREVPEHFKTLHNASVFRDPYGIRRRQFYVQWRKKLHHIVFVLDTELFLVHIHEVSEVPLLVGKWSYNHRVIMFGCSSFGNDSLKYNIEITVKSKEGVSSTSKLDDALAFNNQTIGHIWGEDNFILLPNVNPTSELTLRLNLL